LFIFRFVFVIWCAFHLLLLLHVILNSSA
jgi:hypothetical protein